MSARPPAASDDAERARALIGCFGRLQAVAILATAVDHAVMLAAHAAGLTPTSATAVGALCGALVAFALGRRWVFGADRDAMIVQALRYALVATLSLCLNVAGEAFLVRAGIHYYVARVLVALAVGFTWNYPLQRYWVFVAIEEGAPMLTRAD